MLCSADNNEIQAISGVLIPVVLAVVGVAVWQSFWTGGSGPAQADLGNQADTRPDGEDSPVRLKGTIEYTVRDADGSIKEQVVVRNTVNGALTTLRTESLTPVLL